MPLRAHLCCMNAAAYIRSAATLLAQYEGKTPFAAWLKEYFRKEKKFGSRDRRTVSQLCFAYFRTGKLFASEPPEEAIRLASELAPDAALAPDDLRAVFPLHAHISKEIGTEAFIRAHLKQPDLFLRLRPGKEEGVRKKLEAAGISFTVCAPDCLALPNGRKIEEILVLDEEVVVQDRSSQQVLSGLQEVIAADARFSLWDCCAASGGKSILALDRFPRVQLTVSDVRESILHNLRSRFRSARINNYRSFVADVAAAQFSFPHQFDVVLCDAPCSGSGTWGRTPEQLTYFTADRIDHYASLQRQISKNAIRQVKKGGYFLYVTCSVFSAENEDNAAFIQKESGLTLLSARYYKGYELKADTLFAALFKA
jgi:16S rRNA (cytosine967-C5)-methyltransferase